jgi:hypothetical protein
MDLGVDDVRGMIDIEITSGDESTLVIKGARLVGLNSKLRERIAAMRLDAAGIPIRIRGIVEGSDGQRGHLVITRNEEGSVLVDASEQGRQFLAAHGGANGIFAWFLQGSLKDLNVKLD